MERFKGVTYNRQWPRNHIIKSNVIHYISYGTVSQIFTRVLGIIMFISFVFVVSRCWVEERLATAHTAEVSHSSVNSVDVPPNPVPCGKIFTASLASEIVYCAGMVPPGFSRGQGSTATTTKLARVVTRMAGWHVMGTIRPRSVFISADGTHEPVLASPSHVLVQGYLELEAFITPNTCKRISCCGHNLKEINP